MSAPSPNLPAGWDESRIRNATPQELDALSDEDFTLIQSHIASQIRSNLPASAVAAAAATAASTTTIQPATTSRHSAPFVTALRSSNLLGADWGFVVFRLNYAPSTDAAWTTYTTQLAASLHSAVDPRPGEWAEDADMADARAGLGVLWADDSSEEVGGRGLEAVRAEYRVLRDRGDVPEGMQHGVVLLADEEAVESLLSLDGSRVGVQRHEQPWLVAVDVAWSGRDGEKDEDDYGGSFRVAVRSLLTELFPLFTAKTLSPKELALMVDNDEVWTGAV